jgi:ABC-type dipeptide/oligopeptide/nickel transport system ATPase component
MSGAVSPSVLLEVRDLRTAFLTRAGRLPVVDGVSFTLERGKVLGLVGESGSGKTVTGFSIMGLIDPPGRIVEGRSICLHGRGPGPWRRPNCLRAMRGAQVAMIFQDPMMPR